MKLLLRQARIIHHGSPYDNQVKDILVTDGTIQQIDDSINIVGAHEIAVPGLHVSAGFADVFAHFADPGYEHRETLASGARAAAAGGYTDVMLIPNTQPAIASKSQVEYLMAASAGLPVTVHPMGAISKQAEGKELAEMYDMHNSGAVAFSDGISPVQHTGLMLKALQYVQARNAVLIQVPDDKSVHPGGLMNEGVESTRLGLPGKPAIAEELMIARDIELLRYTGSRLHITGISTRKGIELVKQAKKEGLKVTCSATPYHAYFTDEDLRSYDTNLKVMPPLRSGDDRMAVREGLLDGSIDCIASHHLPAHWDDKTCEFEYAKSGMASIETVFGAVNSWMNNISLLIALLTTRPRGIFGLVNPAIEEGANASLCLFDPLAEITWSANKIQSASANNAFTGQPLKGKIIGTIHKNQFVSQDI